MKQTEPSNVRNVSIAGFLALLFVVIMAIVWRNSQAPEPDITRSPVETPAIVSPVETPEPTRTSEPTATPTRKPETPVLEITPVATEKPVVATPEPTETPEKAEPTVRPAPTITPTPYEIIIVKGDWLSKIALRHTGDPLDWPEIVAVHDAAARDQQPENQHLRRNIWINPDLIYEGEIIRLPQEWAPAE